MSPRSAARPRKPRDSTRAKDDIRVEDGVVKRASSKPASSRKRARSKGKKTAKPKKRKFTAKNADRHELYELAVQSPEEDVKFIARVYKTFRKKPAVHLRELVHLADLRMRQLRSDSGLLEKHADVLRFAAQIPSHALDRDPLAKPCGGRELRRIDLGHTAPREPAEERVPAKALRAMTPALQNAGLRYIIQRRALGA